MLTAASRIRTSPKAPSRLPRTRQRAAAPVEMASPSSCSCGGACPRCAGGASGGLPEALKAGVESLSGVALDGVRVHYNSPHPAALQALAYTDGADIHLAPGEDRHLPHEAWHVAQQKQGRVTATFANHDLAINDDASLEREADTMGAKAAAIGAAPSATAHASVDAPATPVVQSETKEPLSAEAQAARAEIEKLSKKGYAALRPRKAEAVMELFKRAGVEITKVEAWNWRDTGKINPYIDPGPTLDSAPSNFEPVRNQKVVDDWNAQMAAALGVDTTAGEVTTTGDGAQIKGWVDDSSTQHRRSGAGASTRRDPLQQKALEAMQAYDTVDRKALNIMLLFSDKPVDAEKVKVLRERGAWVDDKSAAEAPPHATYVLGTSTTTPNGKVIRQFLGSGIIVDNAEGRWTTITPNDMGARTDTMLRALKFSSKAHSELKVIGWFVPEKMPQLGEIPGQKPGDLKDAYDMTNKVTRDTIDRDQQKVEGKNFALLGHQWMGADWHGAEDYGYAMKDEVVLDETGHIKFKEKSPGVKETDAKGYYVMETKQVRVRVDKAVTPSGVKAQELAYKILAGNPEKMRNPEDGSKGSYFTTCLATSTKILLEYGVDANVFGGLMAPVFQDPKQQTRPRDTEMFQYLKQTGAWIWGYEGFVPEQGDIFLTGSYIDTVNVKDKSRGLWTFQHVGIVANTMKNDDGTYTLLSQDGGKGQASIGEDKTGYTIRNYDPKTRLSTGANPKLMIGVWRPGILKAALYKLPPEIKATLTGGRLQAYQNMMAKASAKDDAAKPKEEKKY